MTDSPLSPWPVRGLRIMALVGGIAAIGGAFAATSTALGDYRTWVAAQAVAAGVTAVTALVGLRTVAGARTRGADPRAVQVTATAWNAASTGCIAFVAAVPALGWVTGSAVQPLAAAMSAACAAALVVCAVGVASSLRPSAVRATLDA